MSGTTVYGVGVCVGVLLTSLKLFADAERGKDGNPDDWVLLLVLSFAWPLALAGLAVHYVSEIFRGRKHSGEGDGDADGQ